MGFSLARWKRLWQVLEVLTTTSGGAAGCMARWEIIHPAPECMRPLGTGGASIAGGTSEFRSGGGFSQHRSMRRRRLVRPTQCSDLFPLLPPYLVPRLWNRPESADQWFSKRPLETFSEVQTKILQSGPRKGNSTPAQTMRPKSATMWAGAKKGNSIPEPTMCSSNSAKGTQRRETSQNCTKSPKGLIAQDLGHGSKEFQVSS